MTLTNRLLLFFLVTLALVLAGFSTTLYWLARQHLHRQADERLESALNTLVAAAEIRADCVEWEPSERSISIAPRGLGDQLAWVVTDGGGRVVARSEQPETDDLLTEAAARLADGQKDFRRIYWQGSRWQASQRWILPDSTRPAASPASHDPAEVRFPSLVVTTALPLEPMRTTLRLLIVTMSAVSGFVFVLAIFAGRAVCRRALAPLRQMAADSRTMTSIESGQRLDHPAYGDELEDLGRSFNGLLDRLQASFERQKRFAGDASHQLRTPLAALMGQIEVALRHPRTGEEYEQVLNRVHSRAAHLNRIIESLLFLARVDGEPGLLDFEELNLADWVPAHVASWNDHERFADLCCDIRTGSSTIRAHAVLLGELLNVLLDNACRYSPPGTPITVRLETIGGESLISVLDEGCGIAASELPHIFEPFNRSANSTRTHQHGLGLGLAIAARLARIFGGTLDVESQPGRGSRFTIAFAGPDSAINSAIAQTH